MNEDKTRRKNQHHDWAFLEAQVNNMAGIHQVTLDIENRAPTDPCNPALTYTVQRCRCKKAQGTGSFVHEGS